MAATWSYLGPRLVGFARREGTVLPGQPASVPAFGYAEERAKIRAHAARCGIDGDGARHLVVDDATLFAFEDLREPMHLVYVSDATMWGPDLDGNRDAAFFRAMRSPGVITRCAYFPTKLVAKARTADGYCCVGAADLLPPLLRRGEPILFAADGNADPFLLGGWSWGDPGGRWSVDTSAELAFAVDDAFKEILSLRFEASAPLLGRREADVDVFVDGALGGTLHFDEAENDVNDVRRLDVRRPPSRVHEVAFRPRDVRSPAELGISNDPRPLGVWLHAFWLD
jgi:hypothetical protein